MDMGSAVILNLASRENEQASRSPAVWKMFDTNMHEKNSGTIQIDDARLPIMHTLIHFCYTADIKFSDKITAEDVLQVAHKYDIDFLRKLCERHLITTINDENVPKMLKIAERFEGEALQTATRQYFREHFNDVIDGVVEELC